MKLYAQQGYGTGNSGDKIISGLERNVIDGAILSPKDYPVSRAAELLERMADEFPTADRLFDPQLYASLIAHDPSARMGRLLTSDYPYFSAQRRNQLETEANVEACIRSCLRFQMELNVSSIIAPNIVIRRSLDSIESAIAKSFVRHASTIWSEIGDSRPLYVTLAIDGDALLDRNNLESFLSDITIMDGALQGFYVLIASPTSEIQPELIDFRTLAGWMLLNHALSLNGFTVINGFSDILTPFLGAAGAAAGATGWWANLKVFSMDRFEPPSPGGRRPIPRYLSAQLLNSIRFDELERLRRRFPTIVNGLPSDDFYSEEDGSEPSNLKEEILQSWDAISSLLQNDLYSCMESIESAKQLYFSINASPGMRLTARSDDSHLERLEEGVLLFTQLAEIDL